VIIPYRELFSLWWFTIYWPSWYRSGHLYHDRAS